MSIWSAWEDISRVMAVLCLVTAGAAFVAAGILLVREELTGRLWDTLKSEAGKRKGILILAAAGVWILVIGRSVSAAEVTQAGSTASTAASTEAGTESESSSGLTSGHAPGNMSEAAAEGISETAVATAAESTSEAESATAGGSEADDPEAEKSAEGSGTAEAATEGKTDDGKNVNIRTTNARKYWAGYQAHPYTTRVTLENLVNSYLNSLPYKTGEFFKNEIDEIEKLFTDKDRTSARCLSPEFLHGYYLERNYLKTFRKTQEPKDGAVPGEDGSVDNNATEN